jgi:hypothetical protein
MFHGVPPISANGDKVSDTLFSDRPRKDQDFGVVQATYGKDMWLSGWRLGAEVPDIHPENAL